MSANHLESGVWMNRAGEDGKPRFEWIALPRFAQIAPVYGIIASDFDFDGNVDLHVVQNSYSTQPETGLWRGGLSQLLLGNGDGTFRCVPAKKSGVVIADDGKASALVDLDGDGRLELVATQNNGEALVFKSEEAPLLLRVEGGIGARVELGYGNSTAQDYEVKAGSGYLSQSPAVLQVKSEGLKSIKVRWPDGKEKSYPAAKGERRITLAP